MSVTGGAPTGQVFNPTSSFALRSGMVSVPAMFLFASENGTITGWSPHVDALDRRLQRPERRLRGTALVRTEDGPRRLATSFRAGTVDVFDGAFHELHDDGAFRDPSLAAGYAVRRRRRRRGRARVVRATGRDAARRRRRRRSQLRRRVHDRRAAGASAHHARALLLWEMVVAPEHFGDLGGDLLVGDFGDGTIHAYDRDSGKLVATLHDAQHHDPVIDGLWALRFGNGAFASRHTLVFSAGPDGESHGLLGTLTSQHADD